MAHIKLNNNIPGIRSLFVDFPKIGAAMSALAQSVLRDQPLPDWFCEFVASYVSRQNTTEFCGRSHMAAAKALSGISKDELYAKVYSDAKLSALMSLADQVVGNEYTGAKIHHLVNDGIATREEVHCVVTIAAAFSMFNRYVKGLGVNNPKLSLDDYTEMGKMMAEQGYIRKTQTT